MAERATRGKMDDEVHEPTESSSLSLLNPFMAMIGALR